MKEDILFSIIVPAFNTEKYIGESLESVLKQSCGNFEIILVDDGSTDNTICVAESYAQIDDRVVLVKHASNKGLLEARFTGLKKANGKYVLFLDSDDYFADGILETLCSELQDSQTDIIEFGYTKVPENIEVICNNDYSCLPGGILDNRYPHTVWNKCYSRQVVDKVVASFEPFYCNMSEDEFYSFVFSFYAKNYSRISECLYCYRTGTGMSSSNRMTESALLKSLDSIEAKTEALKVFVGKKCPEFLPLVSKAKQNDLEYLADIIMASKSSFRFRKKLLKTIDIKAQTFFGKTRGRYLNLFSAIARRLAR